MSNGPHAASRWLVELSVNSPTRDADPSDPKPDVDPVASDINALDEQADNAGLFGGEKFVPERFKRIQCASHLGLGHAFCGFSNGAPCLDDDFRGKQQKADLIDHDLLDLGGRNARDAGVALNPA